MLTHDTTNGHSNNFQIEHKLAPNLNCMARDAKYAPTKIETSVNPDGVGMISVSDDLISVF